MAEEGITELGWDQAAIISLLWHSSQTDWFEYNAGSKLVHFRFLLRYRKAARDGASAAWPTQAELKATTKRNKGRMEGVSTIPTIKPRLREAVTRFCTEIFNRGLGG
jgi:hypothetical protein